MKSVLLTRSKSANQEIKKRLEKHDYELLECSLIKYELQDFDLVVFNKFSNVIITSSFAADHMPNINDRQVYAWVVGKKSAKILESKGYIVKYIADDATSLKNKIPLDIYQDTIYPSSNEISIDMPFKIARVIFYKVFYKESLSNKQLLRYKQGVDYILLYSENCAKTLLKLVLDNNLHDYLENTEYIVISTKIEKVIKACFKNTKILQSTDLILEYLEKND